MPSLNPAEVRIVGLPKAGPSLALSTIATAHEHRGETMLPLAARGFAAHVACGLGLCGADCPLSVTVRVTEMHGWSYLLVPKTLPWRRVGGACAF